MNNIAKNSTNTSDRIDADAEDGTPSRFVSIALMLLLATAAFCASIQPAAADVQHTVYRCVGAKNSISYQDVPCAPHQHTSAKRRFTVHTIDPKAAAHKPAREQDKQRLERSTTRVIRIATTRTQKPKPPSRCKAAKAKRELDLQRLGFKRDFKLLSAIDGAVWDACKGL